MGECYSKRKLFALNAAVFVLFVLIFCLITLILFFCLCYPVQFRISGFEYNLNFFGKKNTQGVKKLNFHLFLVTRTVNTTLFFLFVNKKNKKSDSFLFLPGFCFIVVKLLIIFQLFINFSTWFEKDKSLRMVFIRFFCKKRAIAKCFF